jgi:hypothetical protein
VIPSPGRAPAAGAARVHPRFLARSLGVRSSSGVTGSNPLRGDLERAINASVAEGWDYVAVSDMSSEAFAFAVMKRPKR